MAVLGLDVGTTVCKAAVYRADGTLLGAARHAYPLHQPRPGWAELDAEQVWEVVQQVIRDVMADAPEAIEALAISSMGESIVPVDTRGMAVGPCIVSFDGRSLPQTERLRREVGEEAVYDLCGQILHPMVSATKILWWRDTHPDEAGKGVQYLCAGDFVVRKLGLAPVIDPSMAARTALYDIVRQAWSPLMLEAVGITPDQLAAPQSSGTPIGTIGAERARELGLSRNVVVVAGGHDQPCAALGAGSVDEGAVTYSLGTTETLVYPLERFLATLRTEGYPCYPHVVRDRFVTLAGNFTGGILLQWFRDTFAEQEVRDAQATGRDAYDLLVEEMADTPTDVLVLPHFTTTGPPWNDPESAGAIVGLHLSTTKGEFIRALLEGVTFEIRLNMRHLASFGVSMDYCRVVGSGAKARKVVQLKADLLGTSLVVGHDRDASCRGAALLAAEGARLVPDAATAAGDWQHGLHEIRPREEAMRWYAGRFAVYQHLYPAVKALLQTREEAGL